MDIVKTLKFEIGALKSKLSNTEFVCRGQLQTIENLKAEVERLKAEKQKLLDVLRPVALIGNRLMNTGSLNKYEFLSPSGYRKAYETYSEVTKE